MKKFTVLGHEITGTIVREWSGVNERFYQISVECNLVTVSFIVSTTVSGGLVYTDEYLPHLLKEYMYTYLDGSVTVDEFAAIRHLPKPGGSISDVFDRYSECKVEFNKFVNMFGSDGAVFDVYHELDENF